MYWSICFGRDGTHDFGPCCSAVIPCGSSGWVVFEFHVVSEEYDTFLRTLYKSGFNDVFGDLTQSLFSREGVYSNVKGGAGIFGAECVTVSLR